MFGHPLTPTTSKTEQIGLSLKDRLLMRMCLACTHNPLCLCLRPFLISSRCKNTVLDTRTPENCLL